MSGIAVFLSIAGIWASAGEPLAPELPAPAAEASGAVAAEPPAATRARESVGSLLAESPGAGGPEEAGGRGIFFRMLGWVAALGLGAVAVVRMWKRFAPAARAGGADGGGLRVVARTALTSRHSLFAVRVGNARLLVVGVSGDRIAPLTELDDPAAVVSFDPTFRKALEGAGAPDGGEREAAGDDLDSRLGSYRSEVHRLREMVRGWRGKIGRPGAARGTGKNPEGSAAGRA